MLSEVKFFHFFFLRPDAQILTVVKKRLDTSRVIFDGFVMLKPP